MLASTVQEEAAVFGRDTQRLDKATIVDGGVVEAADPAVGLAKIDLLGGPGAISHHHAAVEVADPHPRSRVEVPELRGLPEPATTRARARAVGGTSREVHRVLVRPHIGIVCSIAVVAD